MMNQKRQAFNPFLPINTYIPDGEPHVFGDRVYLFGSHDKEAGEMYCMLDYEVWSAPITDLTDWSCKGTSFSASQPVIERNESKIYLCTGLCKGKRWKILFVLLFEWR